jgi:hypothetical protein
VAAGIGVAGTAAHAHPGPSDSGSHARGHHEPGLTPELRQVRQATRAFRDVKAAEAAGYEAASPCESDPKYGGMGIHYGNPELVADGKLGITAPTDADRPFLFDLPFDGPMLGHNPQMPIHYDLHVWLYRHNPAGMFAAWNPLVRCP